MGGSDNTRDGLASQSGRYRMLNQRQVGVASLGRTHTETQQGMWWTT